MEYQDFVKSLESLTFEEAKDASVEMVSKRDVRTMGQKAAKAQTIRDIQNAPNRNEVVRIMYQQLLASEGLRTNGSAWKKKYDSI
jgi:lipopolysaccharide biosynthesis regulator YciM